MSLAVISQPQQPALQVKSKAAQMQEGAHSMSAEEIPTLHVPEVDPYSVELETMLFQKSEMLIDFSSLKTCLDPQREPAESNDEREFDYKAFVYDTLENKSSQFTLLETLTLRKIQPISPNNSLQNWDEYTTLYHSVFQLSSLTKLDISENTIFKELQENLQFWNVPNLKTLIMDNNLLQMLPASVGRLQHLEHLSLEKNGLRDLPVTLRFCHKLRYLNISRNQFKQLPGVVLHLKGLQDLKRLGSPLTARYEMHGPHFTRITSKNNTQTNGQVKFNPQSLQTLCTKTVYSAQLDYWKQQVIGPLQCKTLDRLAGTFKLCENCQRAIPSEAEHTVEVLLITFLGLSGVPFLLNVCSKDCQETVKTKYGEMNIQLQKELDEKYEREMKEAQRLVRNNEVDISPETVNAPEGTVQQFVPWWPRGVANNRNNRRRRRQKCAIM